MQGRVHKPNEWILICSATLSHGFIARTRVLPVVVLEMISLLVYWENYTSHSFCFVVMMHDILLRCGCSELLKQGEYITFGLSTQSRRNL